MRRLLLTAGVIGTVSAIIVLAYYLFISGGVFLENTSVSAGSVRPEDRVIQLEQRIRGLSTRLNDSDRRLAQWEDSRQTGEVPEYYRERLDAAGGSAGYYPRAYSSSNESRKPGATRRAEPERKLEKEGKSVSTDTRIPAPAGTKKKKADSTDKSKDGKAEKSSRKEPRYVGGLLGLYYQGRKFEDLKLVMTDYEIDFDFADRSPDRIITEDNFSIRWSGYIKIESEAEYSFHTFSDDGVRLWIAGRPVINNWGDHSSTLNSGKIKLKKGYHSLRLDFYEHGGAAIIKLYWSTKSVPMEIIPSAYLYHDLGFEEKARKEVN
jgi:hypothetical protein